MSDTSSMTGSQYVTAFFDNRADADAATDRIVAEGVPQSDIRVVAGNESGTDPATTDARQDTGFFASLGEFFMPNEDRHAYAEGLNRGGYLVTVNTTAENRDRVLDILDDEGTVDMDEREAGWRAEGWSGYQSDPVLTDPALTDPAGTNPTLTGESAGAGAMPLAGETGTTGRSATSDMRTGDTAPIEVMEEQLRVGKRQMEGGRVRVRSYVVEQPVEEQVTLRDETVHVHRTPVDRAATASDGSLFTDRTLEATETDEEAIVSKEARIVEEISLDKDAEQRTETVRDSVRHTEVEIEDDRTNRTDPAGRTDPTDRKL